MFKKTTGLFLLTAFIFISFAAAPALAGGRFMGEWEGRVEVPGSPLGVIVTLTEKEGELTGSMDIPAQNAFGIELIKLEVEENKIFFELKNIPGNPRVEAYLDEGKRKMTGDFSQAGLTFPIELSRDRMRAADLNVEALDGFEDFIEAVRQDWNTPGLAVGIVTGDEILFAGGTGYLDLDKTAPITDETLFGIGSVTKPFTTMLLAILVDDGLLSWDDPVKNYIDFNLDNDPVSDLISVRDLVSHRAGLPRYDFTLIFNEDLAREDILANIRHMERTGDFRNSYQYSNYNYVLAGILIEELTGMTWEEAVRERIFSPAGMDHSNLNVTELKKSANYALPYLADDRFLNADEVDFWELGASAPAGSINSSIVDMSKWLQIYLKGGRINDEQLISGRSLRQLSEPVISISGRGADDYTSHLGYGPGWFTSSYRGEYKIEHGGVTFGYSASAALFPEKDLGIVVLANLHGSPAAQIITNTAVDLLLDLEEVNWKEDYLALMGEESLMEEFSVLDLERRKEGTRPSHTLEEMTGSYTHPLYGTFHLKLQENKMLVADYHGTEIQLEHWHYNVFKGSLDRMGPMQMAFSLETNLHGEINSLKAGLDVFLTDSMIEFMRD